MLVPSKVSPPPGGGDLEGASFSATKSNVICERDDLLINVFQRYIRKSSMQLMQGSVEKKL
jgi:hypothetical protein